MNAVFYYALYWAMGFVFANGFSDYSIFRTKLPKWLSKLLFFKELETIPVEALVFQSCMVYVPLLLALLVNMGILSNQAIIIFIVDKLQLIGMTFTAIGLFLGLIKWAPTKKEKVAMIIGILVLVIILVFQKKLVNTDSFTNIFF